MHKIIGIVAITLGFSAGISAQSVTPPIAGPALPLSAMANYQPTTEKKFDLQHIRLDVSFDYSLQRMPGKAWVTVKPHFYPQQVLVLDAKGMFIHKVALVAGSSMIPLSYDYSDSMQLKITLDKTYSNGQSFTVYIAYTARPNELKTKGSRAITDAKGLYFINPEGKDSTKPIQIWTQGETEATSVWCPIIDKPNQKTTSEISMTVPARYVSLSNGKMVKQVPNKNGTRTDTWKMDLPHSPYLFFMGVGDFAVVKDRYKNIPVDYYVRKEYEPVARKIFGETPAMIAYFSQLLGVEYPWAKYAQMVGEDYVSGAMENTTATLHGAGAYQNARQLKDENKWEIVVAHELFHHWFGDLVTAESWSNLTVNESFADYSEYLWLEHKYGKDHALFYNKEAMQAYLSNPTNSSKHLVRFQYEDKEDMFDAVSYQKGGRILNMLRHYVGDSAFFKGMQLYLTTNKFKNGEAHQLRLAMEEVSGKDLNWFFDQWFFGAAHPAVNISYRYNEAAKNVQIIIEQTQTGNLFHLPVTVAVYTNGKSNHFTYWIGKQRADTIGISYEIMPNWINVDPAKMMLWSKTNHQSEAHWLEQAKLGTNSIDKAEALDYLMQNWKETPAYEEAIATLLQDSYIGIRKAVLQALRRGNIALPPATLQLVAKLAQNEKDLPTRAYAMDVLSGHAGSQYSHLFEKALQDSSYSVAGAALEALARHKPAAAVAAISTLQKDAKGRLKYAVQVANYLTKDTAEYNKIIAEYKKLAILEKIMETNALLYYANRLTETSPFRKTVGTAVETYKQLRFDFQGMQSSIASTLHWMIQQREAALKNNPDNVVLQEQLKYLKEKTLK